MMWDVHREIVEDYATTTEARQTRQQFEIKLKTWTKDLHRQIRKTRT